MLQQPIGCFLTLLVTGGGIDDNDHGYEGEGAEKKILAAMLGVRFEVSEGRFPGN